MIKALKEGKAIITITPKKGKKATLTVIVKDPNKPSKVTLNRTGKVTLYIGQKLQLNATLAPSTARSKLKWSSSKKKVASVSSKGVVKALKKGTTVITVKTANDKTAKVTIKVVNKPRTPTGIKLNKSGTVEMRVGQSIKLKATLSPSDAVAYFTGSTSDNSIANGVYWSERQSDHLDAVIYAYKVGTATISVRTDNGLKASFKVKVVK